MTWFLKNLKPEPEGTAPAEAPPTSTWERVKASFKMQGIEDDSWNRKYVKEQELTGQLYDMLPEDLQAGVRQGKAQIINKARLFKSLSTAVAQDPGVFGQMENGGKPISTPLDQAAFDQLIEDRRQGEYDENAAIVMGSPASFWPEFAGRGAAAMSDPFSLATLGLGAPAKVGLLGKIALEAGAGAISEAGIIPRRLQVADELDVPEVNPVQDVLLGAGFGGALGGAIGVAAKIPRAVAYAREKYAGMRSAGLAGREAEEALEVGGKVLEDPDFDWAKYRIDGASRDDGISGLDSEFRGGLQGLLTAADAELGPGLQLFSGFRSVERQEQLWQEALQKYGSAAAARKWVAPPGKSQHNHGNAADLKFNGVRLDQADPAVRQWIHENAPKYGLHFPLGNEPWHIEPVGARGGHDHGAETSGSGGGDRTSQIKAFIRDLEAPQGYDQVWGGIRPEDQPPKPLTQMTVDEVLAWQDSIDPIYNSEAAGGYQIIEDTLRGLKANMGLKGDELFDTAMQDRMADELMREAGLDKFLKGDISAETFGRNLSGVWAALPDPGTGLSQYDGDGLNKALTSSDAFMRVLTEDGAYTSRFDGGEGVTRRTGSTTRGYTGDRQMVAGDQRIDVRYEVVDADAVKLASGRFQPRDRTRSASDEQIAEIAARLDPERLMPSVEADRGAPLVGPDDMVESGNGRMMAIRRAYDEHPDRADAYRERIRSFGFDVPEGMKKPVLVARRTSTLDDAGRERLVIDANASAAARMSAPERAIADATILSPDVLASHARGFGIGEVQNRGFVRGVLGHLPQSERNELYTPDGGLNRAGRERVQNAMFAAAYRNPHLISKYSEDEPGELLSLLQALEDAAPAWARLKAEIDAGLVKVDFDITDHVIDAMLLIAQARQKSGRGVSISEALAALIEDPDLLSDAIDPLTAALISKFWSNGKAASRDSVAEFLERFADEARKVGSSTPSLLDDTPDLRDVLQAVDDKAFKDLPEGITAARPPAPAKPLEGADTDAFDDGAAGALAQDGAAQGLEDLKRGLDAPPGGDLEALLAGVELRDAAKTLGPLQPFRTVPDGIKRARRAQTTLERAGADVEKATGATFLNPGVKATATAREKMARKDYASPREMTDLSRGAFLIDTADQAEAVLTELQKHFDMVDEGWKTGDTGYQDRKLLIRHADGMLSEVQVLTRKMSEAKKAETPLYTERRSLGESDARKFDLLAKSREIYAEATDPVIGSGSAPTSGNLLRKSASSVTAAELDTSSASTGRQAPSGRVMANARNTPEPSKSTAGRPSQDVNTVRMSEPPFADKLNVGAKDDPVKSAAAQREELLRVQDAFGDEEITIDGVKYRVSELVEDLDQDDVLDTVISLCKVGED